MAAENVFADTQRSRRALLIRAPALAVAEGKSLRTGVSCDADFLM